MLTSGARRSKTKKGSIVQWDSVAPPVAAQLLLQLCNSRACQCVTIFMWTLLTGWQIQIRVERCVQQNRKPELWAEPISHSGPPKRPHPESQSVSQSVGYHLILASAKLPTCHKLPQLPHRALQLQLQLHSAPHVRLSCLLFWFTLALTLFIDDVSLSRYLSLFLSLSLSLSRRVSGPLLRHPSVRWVAARLSCLPPSPLTPASFFNLANLYTPRCTVVRSCCYYCILLVVRNWFIINMIITLNVQRL